MKLPPFLLRDFRQGRYSKDIVSELLVPENSVANSININFDEVIGSAKVRPGTVKLGDTVQADGIPRGLANFVGPAGSPNLVLAVFSDGGSSTLYYYDTSWNTSNLTTLDPDAKNRFSVLGGSAFTTNNVDGMHDSTDGATWGTTNSIPTYKPSVLYRYQAQMLAAGDPSFPDRVFFSSVVDPTSSPFITWDVNPVTGDWIDVNPDDGGYVTGFSESSTFALIFKNTGMYRMNTVNKTIDPDNIFNVGAVSQEAIVQCQGTTYYFSGVDIRQTNGSDYPAQISRYGVQDFIDAIPVTNWPNVCSGTDQLNVYFAIGDVTLNQNQTNERTYTNVTLKFSPRDQNWSAHSYKSDFKFFSPYVTQVLAL
ncbi:MAG: hypothetical protein V4436_02230 [Patescibacteria group bacterium]